MRTMIVTTPIRPVPTTFPPMGALSILKYLKRNGVLDVEFFDIDANRPTYEEAVEHVCSQHPKVLGISAVVSPAYSYTQRLSLEVKRRLPDTLIVCGGSLAASAEVLLRRTGVDLCVTGEGEQTFLKIVQRRTQTSNPADFTDIPGLVLIDKNDFVINTGYEEQLPTDEVYDFDWTDLEAATNINWFVLPAITDGVPSDSFREDPRAYETHRADKTQITLPASKGCVARCTFCHRFAKGIRYIPVDLIIDRIKSVIERYNVGFIEFADENFGTDKKWLREFCEKIKPLNILWRVGGMRVNCVDPEIIHLMKDAGCSCIIYGMETGSEKMLQVMEKKVALKDNYNAITWTIEAGLRSVVQLVIGMPGESPETIQETAAFVRHANSVSPRQCPTDLSINYAQALPGTPLYEFGRSTGLIGNDLDGEEAYLLRISDTNAHDESNTLNFTSYPKLLCDTWRMKIQIAAFTAYQEKFGRDHYRKMLVNFSGQFERTKPDTGYFANPKRQVDRSATADTINQTREKLTMEEGDTYPSFWRLIARGRIGLAVIAFPEVFARLEWALPLLIVLRSARYQGLQPTMALISQAVRYLIAPSRRDAFRVEHRSLRKTVRETGSFPNDTESMLPLRQGR